MELVANFTLNNNTLDTSFELSEGVSFDALFTIYAAGTTWGSISGDIKNQTDLYNILLSKADSVTVEADLESMNDTITENYNTLDNKIDTVQSDLSGDIAALTQTVTNNNTAINNRVDGIVESFDGDIEYINTSITNLQNTDTNLQGQITTLSGTVTSNYNELSGDIGELEKTVTNNNTAVNNRIDATNQNVINLTSTVSSNYTTLDNKINSVNSELSGNIGELETTVNDNYTNLDGKITTLSNTVDNNNTAINNKVDGINTTLTGSISSLSSTVSSNYATLDNKINTTKTALDGDINDLTDIVTQNYTDLNSAITNGANTINSRIDDEVLTLNTSISAEETARTNADNNLQSQIDAITSASDVTDIVGTYAQLQAYDTTSLPNNSIIKVLSDESRDNETTYYRWVISDGIGAWILIGEEGPYYTKSEADSTFVPQTRTINNKPLSNNITLTASDVNALSNTAIIGNGVLTVQKNGTNIDTFSANATTAKTINITVPTDTSDLTNQAGFLTNEDLTALESTVGSNSSNINTLTSRLDQVDLTLNGKQSELTSDNAGNGIAITTVDGILKISNTQTSAEWGNITGTLSNQTDLQNALNDKYDNSNPAGYISGINSSDVTTALGYTPYNANNPNGYTSNTGTVTSVNNILPVDGNVTLTVPDSLPDQTGNANKFLTTDGTDASWSAVPARNIGEIVTSTTPLIDAGLHLLDGALIDSSGIYSAFVTHIAGLVSIYPNLFVTETEWQTSVSTYGVYDKFVYDSTNNTVRLPKITGIIEGTTEAFYYIVMANTTKTGIEVDIDKYVADINTQSHQILAIQSQIDSLNTKVNNVRNLDYSRSLNVVSPTEQAQFTAPYDGVYVAMVYRNQTHQFLYINGHITAYQQWDSVNGATYQNVFVPLSKGDSIYWTNDLGFHDSKFYPYKA